MEVQPMSDATKIDLEARVADLEKQVSDLTNDLLKGQLEDWKARIDQLEVQARLGEMEARDQVSPIVDQLRNKWLDAKEQFDKTQSAAGDALATLRSGVRNAVDDLGDALDAAVAKLRS
jgi:hypothetical protein